MLRRRPDLAKPIEISTGDFFRNIAEKESLLGKRAKEILDNGERQPDWFAFLGWLSFFGEKVFAEEIVFSSGSPRSLREAGFIDEALEFVRRPQAIAIYFEVSPEEAKKRLLLRARYDDNESAIDARMDWFETDVRPALDYYEKRKHLIKVNGEQTPEEVFKELCEKLDSFFA